MLLDIAAMPGSQTWVGLSSNNESASVRITDPESLEPQSLNLQCLDSDSSVCYLLEVGGPAWDPHTLERCLNVSTDVDMLQDSLFVLECDFYVKQFTGAGETCVCQYK